MQGSFIKLSNENIPRLSWRYINLSAIVYITIYRIMITSEDLYRQLMELNVSALCVNLFLNASEMPLHQVERVYNLRNNIIKASEMIVQYEKENPQKAVN